MTDLIYQFSDTSLDAVASRRAALRKTGQLGLTAALAAIPFLKPGRAQAQSTSGDLGILNYALTLEFLERSFYRQAEDTGLIPDEYAGLFELIKTDEEAHVALLIGAIEEPDANGVPMGEAVDYEDSDFTFVGPDGTDFLSSFELIATLAQGLEDTGVRAYKGQATAIMSPEYLQVALQIHSVEARHAAAIRRLPQSPAVQGWIPFNQPNANGTAIAATYAGEGQTTQGGVSLPAALSGYTEEQITEAFDEPLTMAEVLAIAGPFITGEEGDTPEGDG